MTAVDFIAARQRAVSLDADLPHSDARLVAIGTAVPPRFTSQEAAGELWARIWRLEGAARERWNRIIAGTEIDQRHGVLPVEEVIRLTTAQRMSAYEQHAPVLAFQAARRALQQAGKSANEVTDLIVVSCTGFAAPGVDVALVDLLNLRPDVRRTLIGFMGCYGAITGLRAAVGTCAAHRFDNRRAVTLVVCVELCSLHARPDRDIQNQVASALFADGAAAAVVESNHDSGGGNDDEPKSTRPFIGQLTAGASTLLRHGRDCMTWRVTDAGFAMTLSREVPVAIRDNLRSFIDDLSPRRADRRPRAHRCRRTR
jgi:predicted naringenin-chalcone synthase